MGMNKMFSNGAEFDELLTTNEPLKVSQVVHKAFIEVNEEGAEAAAATGRLSLILQTIAGCVLLSFLSLCSSAFTGPFSKPLFCFSFARSLTKNTRKTRYQNPKTQSRLPSRFPC
jgi:hypothetical protein